MALPLASSVASLQPLWTPHWLLIVSFMLHALLCLEAFTFIFLLLRGPISLSTWWSPAYPGELNANGFFPGKSLRSLLHKDQLPNMCSQTSWNISFISLLVKLMFSLCVSHHGEAPWGRGCLSADSCGNWWEQTVWVSVQLHHLTTMWVCYSLCLSFLICNMGTWIVPISQGHCEYEMCL